MKATLADGKTFHFSFQHITTPAEVEYELLTRLGLSRHHRLVRQLPKALTLCFIEEEHGEEKPMPLGMAFCAEGDNFCKEIGRKRSLERALAARFPHSSKENYQIRKAFWDSYFSRKQQMMVGV